jgi:nucleoside-diphosphate-sugar epimerase
LVTGGAGFLGINLCRALLVRGDAVRSIDIAPFDYPDRQSVDVHRADVRDVAAVDRTMRDVDVVVHCAAALPRSRRSEIVSTNVTGTRIVLDSAVRHGVERVVFISSTAVYGIPDHQPIVETDRLRGVGPYGEAKVEGEQLCVEFRRIGLCVPILRPKTFVGPERLGVFELLYDWAYSGKNFPVLGAGDNLYQLLDVDDLCDAIVSCATLDRGVVNDTFNIGAQEFCTMRENVQAVLDRAGHGKRAIGLPAGPATALLGVLERLHVSPLYPWIYRTAAHDSVVSIERARQRLGFAPRYSNRAALTRNYEWYVAHRAEYVHKTGATHRVPWKKGALRIAKWLF